MYIKSYWHSILRMKNLDMLKFVYCSHSHIFSFKTILACAHFESYFSQFQIVDFLGKKLKSFCRMHLVLIQSQLNLYVLRLELVQIA